MPDEPTLRFRVFCKAIETHLDGINMYSSALLEMYWKNPEVDERLMVVAEHELDQAAEALCSVLTDLQKTGQLHPKP